MQVHSLSVSPGGELGASGAADGKVKIWETKSGAVRVHMLSISWFYSAMMRAPMSCDMKLFGFGW